MNCGAISVEGGQDERARRGVAASIGEAVN